MSEEPRATLLDQFGVGPRIHAWMVRIDRATRGTRRASFAALALTASLGVGGAGCGDKAADSPTGPGCEGAKCDDVDDAAPACAPEDQLVTARPVLSSPALAMLTVVTIVPEPDSEALFLVDKGGAILKFKDLNATAPVGGADLRSRVQSGPSQAGLLGLALHPSVRDNHQLFVFYTADRDSGEGIEARVSRFEMNDANSQVKASSEEILLRVELPAPRNLGGHLEFGPDGMLYIGLGDGGSFENGSDDTTLLGSILRIDVDVPGEDGKLYSSPADNPLVGADGRDEIFALGLRDPARFSFDAASGELIVGDVGIGVQELNIVAKGDNLGWPHFAGDECVAQDTVGGECDPSSVVFPVTSYDRSEGLAVTAGRSYRGQTIPALAGAHLFADASSGQLFALINSGQAPAAGGECCAVCTVGQACGDACISAELTCEQPAGCACDASGAEPKRERILASGRRITSFVELHDGELVVIDASTSEVLLLEPGACTDEDNPPPDTRDFNFLSIDGSGNDKQTEEYYRQIAPDYVMGETTLKDFEDDFMDGQTLIEANYQNSLELGTWREMVCTETIDRGVGGCWVRNWKSEQDFLTGNPALALDTVAMNVSEDGFTRFYAFDPDLLLEPSVVLDSEEEKFLPQVCTACHNGQWNGVGSSGDLGSIFREFEPSVLGVRTGLDPDEADAEFKSLDDVVVTANKALRSEAQGGSVGIDHAKAAMLDYISNIFDEDGSSRDISDPGHIPPSWKADDDDDAREIKEALFSKVVNPYCMSCHRANEIDLAQYDEFAALGKEQGGEPLLLKYIDGDLTTVNQLFRPMPQSQLQHKTLSEDEDAQAALAAWLTLVEE